MAIAKPVPVGLLRRVRPVEPGELTLMTPPAESNAKLFGAVMAPPGRGPVRRVELGDEAVVEVGAPGSSSVRKRNEKTAQLTPRRHPEVEPQRREVRDARPRRLAGSTRAAVLALSGLVGRVRLEGVAGAQHGKAAPVRREAAERPVRDGGGVAGRRDRREARRRPWPPARTAPRRRPGRHDRPSPPRSPKPARPVRRRSRGRAGRGASARRYRGDATEGNRWALNLAGWTASERARCPRRNMTQPATPPASSAGISGRL